MSENNYSPDVALIGTSRAINELIINEDFSTALDNAVKILGVAFDSDCFISKIDELPDNQIDFSIEHYSMKADNPIRLEHNNNLPSSVFQDILDEIKKEGFFSYKKSESMGVFKSHLNHPEGSNSGILLPITVNNKVWGIFSLTDKVEEHDFTRVEIAILKSLTTAMGTAISNKLYQSSLEEDLSNKTKEVLYRNKQMLSLINNVPGVVFRCKNDEEWTMEYISGYVEEMTGYTPAEFTSDNHDLTFYKIMHPLDREIIQQEIDDQLTDGSHYQVTYRIHDRSGQIHWFWEQGLKAQGDNMLEGCILDITDKVEANERLLSTTIETEERERSRIAREIHDNLQQLLTTAHLNLQGFVKKVNNIDAKGMEHFNIANEYLQKAIGESRTISHRLMPKDIEDYGFQMAVNGMLESLQESTDIKFNFADNLKGERLPVNIELVLYRITQEAITNILKFSEASEANIQLIKHSHSLILTIEDDGVGFDKKEMNNFKSSFGMNGMINRTSSIGGSLYLDTSKGRGTQLTIEVPLTKK